MIVATFVGGPRDGDEITLPDCHRSLKMAVPIYRDWFAEKPLSSPCYREVEMRPELTATGWVLRWKEPAC